MERHTEVFFWQIKCKNSDVKKNKFTRKNCSILKWEPKIERKDNKINAKHVPEI